AIARIIAVSRVDDCLVLGDAPDSRGVFFRAPAISLPWRQECLGLTGFLPLGIGVLGQVHQLAEVLGCLRPAPSVAGTRGGPPDGRGVFFRATAISLTWRQECLGLPGFLPVGIGVPGQVHQLAGVLGWLLAVTCAVGSAGGSAERAEAVGGLLERGFELAHRG